MMEITFYGVRGSIPVPGKTTLRYGGNTVCVLVRLADGMPIVLDGGSGMRECGKALLADPPAGPIHVLHTHVHWDHVIGIPFFGPLYQRDMHVRVFPLMNEAQDTLRTRTMMFGGVNFPVRHEDLPARIEMLTVEGPVWRVGSAEIRRITLNHRGGAQGFRIDDADGRSLTYLTDNELSPPGPVTTSIDELARFCHGVDVLIHDTQYLASDMPAKHGWGHSTLDDVLALAARAETPHALLFHHDPERDDAALDRIGEVANEWLREHAPATKATVAYEGLVLRL
jgi:phosphoribosyl 1,2-cyclic phosphodiesterase